MFFITFTPRFHLLVAKSHLHVRFTLILPLNATDKKTALELQLIQQTLEVKVEAGKSGTGDYCATSVLQPKPHRGFSTVRGDPFHSHGICFFRSLLRSSILKPLRVSDLPYLPGLLLPLSFMFLTPWFNRPSLSQPHGHKLSSWAASRAPAHRSCSEKKIKIKESIVTFRIE